MSATVLVTGGAGYIGSHTVISLVEAGYTVHIVDNLDNSSEESVRRVKELVGQEGAKRISFAKLDMLEKDKLDAEFAQHKPSAVIHFAGLKAVGESVQKPLRYYHNNITGTLYLLECMEKHGCKQLVFSSSATVYGDPEKVPCTESSPTSATNPYGRTKLFIESILSDQCVSDPQLRVVLLRYFNPVGAHISGRIGEDPKGIPNNLMPFVQQVAVGRREQLAVYGDDWPTPDGTGVRDYIHVCDLARGHVAAMRKAEATSNLGCVVYNLGTGKGTSVLEMVAAFEKASGKQIKVVMAPRRPGDIATNYADPVNAKEQLGWVAEKSIEDCCVDQWRWCSNNPYGYGTAEASS